MPMSTQNPQLAGEKTQPASTAHYTKTTKVIRNLPDTDLTSRKVIFTEEKDT